MTTTIMQQVSFITVGSLASKMVLLKLADQADTSGTSFPSHRFLSECCEVSERSVRNQLKYLVEQGWITISNRHDDTGRQRSNFYHVNIDKIHTAYRDFIEKRKQRRNQYQKPHTSVKAAAPSRQSIKATKTTEATTAIEATETQTCPAPTKVKKSLEIKQKRRSQSKSYPQANATKHVKTRLEGGNACREEAENFADHVGGNGCRHNLLEINKKTLSATLAASPKSVSAYQFDDLPFQALREQVNLDDFEICRRFLKNK